MPSSGFDWLLPTFERLDFVRKVDLNTNWMTVTRKNLPEAVLGLFSEQRLAHSHIQEFIDSAEVFHFIVNTPREGRFMGDAIDTLEAIPAGWGGVADAIRALRDCEEIASYSNRELAFIRRGLYQHSAVKDMRMLDSSRIEVVRTPLPNLVLYIDSTYQPTVDSVRSAVENYAPFDIYVSSNPNVGPTPEAISLGNNMDVEVLRWPQTLGRLNR